MERVIITALVMLAGVLLGIAPLLRAQIPLWQIGLFAACSALGLGIVCWRSLAPLPPRWPRNPDADARLIRNAEQMREFLRPRNRP